MQNKIHEVKKTIRLGPEIRKKTTTVYTGTATTEITPAYSRKHVVVVNYTAY